MTAPRFSIITPTILRSTLRRTCRSVDAQTYPNWEHIVMIDVAPADPVCLSLFGERRRHPVLCAFSHRDGGATCRHNAWGHARGEYLLYLDDDDFLRHDALSRLDAFLWEHDEPNFAVFPVDFCGTQDFLKLPPGEARTPICGFTHRWVINGLPIRYPVGGGYSADSIFAGELARRFGWRALVEGPGLAVAERLRSHPSLRVRALQWAAHLMRRLAGKGY